MIICTHSIISYDNINLLQYIMFLSHYIIFFIYSANNLD